MQQGPLLKKKSYTIITFLVKYDVLPIVVIITSNFK